MGVNLCDKYPRASPENNPYADLEETIKNPDYGDMIMTDASGRTYQSLRICSEQYITKSICIIGYNGQSRLTCNKTSQDVTILIFTSVGYNYIYKH